MKKLNRISRSLAEKILMAGFIFFCTGQLVRAIEIPLTLQDAPLTVLKDSSTTKKINSISNGVPGHLSLRVKWHAMTFTPNVFNKLKIEILHGTRVLKATECYSTHSDKDPKCYISQTINETEASQSGDYKLKITNSSGYDVNGLNIVKEATDLNPFVTNVISTFEPNCSTRYLTVSEKEIGTGETITMPLSGMSNQAGTIRIRAKWHTDVLTPNIFNELRVELLRNGQVVAGDYGFSIHSDQRNKLDITYTVPQSQVSVLGWELRINNTYLKVKGFGIEKGGDSNPFVPQFRSTFVPTCN